MQDLERSRVDSHTRTCPACNAATIRLPMFTTRRRHPVTCTGCGARLERILPGAAYYSLSFITGLLAEGAAFALLILGIMGQWGWIALITAVVVAINLATSAFLNARTRVEFADPADARKDKPGRWYPQ